MINRVLNKIFTLIFLTTIINFNLTLANEIEFKAKTIETVNENKIIATSEIIVTDQNGNKIFGDKLEIDNKSRIYLLEGNIKFIDKDGNSVVGKKLKIDQNKKEYIFSGDVIYENRIKNFFVYSNEIFFFEKEKKFFSKGETKFNLSDKYFADGKNIFLDNSKKSIYSDYAIKINDNLGNEFSLNSFKFNSLSNLMYGENVIFTDNKRNIYEVEKIFIDIKNNEIIGKDVLINNDNQYLITKENVPRSKSIYLISTGQKTILNKTVYTNCQKREGCPPWLIKAEKVEHDKEKKIVKYDNAVFKLYNIPIAYFPKFFHPDPSVDRQSGFLTPTLTSKNSENYLQVPYFFAISENSDFTFTPRLYENSKNLYQGEYRKLTKKTNNIIDFSIKNENPLLLDKDSTDTHLFVKSEIDTDFVFFDKSKINLNFQSVSDEKYLKTFDVRSTSIQSQSTLNSNLIFNGFADNLDFTIEAQVYEDLTKENNNDRYEFVLPNFSLTKSLVNNYNGQLELNTIGYNKLYQTNINEKILVNNLKYNSLDNFNKFGFVNNYEILFKNFNSDSKNSNSFKNQVNTTAQSLFQFNSKLPLFKKTKNYNQFITPISAIKFNPFKNSNIRNGDQFINYDNIYSLNRLSSNDVLEGGLSITLGNEYKIFSQKNVNEELLSFNVATSIRAKENKDLPIKSSLGQKTSNIVGQSKIKLNQFVDLKYDFITDNNFSNFNYHKIVSNFRINNFVTSFEFLEENEKFGNESFIANETSYSIDNNSFAFRTRKNKKTDLTEYYNLIYQYKMDCLTAGIEYKKSYYNDGPYKPEEAIYFSATFMPFANSVKLPGIYNE